MKQHHPIVLFNYIYLAFVILWQLLRTELFGGVDGAGRLVMLMNIIALSVNAKSLSRIPFAGFIMFIWCIYACINTYFQGLVIENIGFFNWAAQALFSPFIAMLIAYLTFKRNFFGTVKIMFIILAVFVILGSLFLRPEIEEYTGVLRFANSLGNVYPTMSCGLSAFGSILLLNENVPKRFKVIIFLLIFLSLAIIVVTGTRKAFGACIIILLATAYAHLMAIKKINSILTLTVLVVIMVLSNVIIDNTVLGERGKVILDDSQYSNNLFLEFLGDRAIQYVEGWEQFLQNPVFGIGVMRFSVTNSFFYGLPLHSEYMVQLTECGLVGASMFLAFHIILVVCIIKPLMRKGHYLKYYISLAGLYVAILFINFTSWTYDDYVFHIYYAMILAFSNLKYKAVRLRDQNIDGKFAY